MNQELRLSRKLVPRTAVAGALLMLGAAAAQPTQPGAEPLPAEASANIPALMTSRADKGLLLGITRAGNEVVAVGGNGVILRSADGQSWTQSPNPTDTALNAVAFADDQHGWAVGHDALILGTADGGKTWQVQNLQPDLFIPMFAVQPLDSRSAIAVGAFGTIKTTSDGGKTWSDFAAPEITDDKLHLNAIARLPSGRLVIAGERGLVGVSADGLQWKRVPTPYEGSFFGILPWGQTGAIAFGMRGNVFVTADAESASWQQIDTRTTTSFFGGQILQGGAVLVSGSEGALLRVAPDGTARSVADEAKSNVTLTGSASIDGSLVLVGEAGARRVPQPP